MERLLNLEELGSRLKTVDTMIMQLVMRRMELAEQVGNYKRKKGEKIFRADIEDQRIETIKQQVLSRSTLWRIVEQYDLYKTVRKRSPTEEVLERLTKDIHIEVMNVKVIDRRTQNPTQATIAFDDHPSARRFSSQVDTVTVDSMFAWLPRTNLFEPPQLVKQ